MIDLKDYEWLTEKIPCPENWPYSKHPNLFPNPVCSCKGTGEKLRWEKLLDLCPCHSPGCTVEGCVEGLISSVTLEKVWNQFAKWGMFPDRPTELQKSFMDNLLPQCKTKEHFLFCWGSMTEEQRIVTSLNVLYQVSRPSNNEGEIQRPEEVRVISANWQAQPRTEANEFRNEQLVEIERSARQALRSERRVWLWKNQDGKCFYCEINVPKGAGTIDYVIPKSMGTAHIRGNVVFSCLKCNMSKGNRLLQDWGKIVAPLLSKKEMGQVKKLVLAQEALGVTETWAPTKDGRRVL